MEVNDKTVVFKERIKQINPNIKIIGDYIRAKDNIDVECLVCGHTWKPTPNKLLCGRGCPKCAIEITKKKLRKTHEKFIEDVYKINPNIKVISKYINSSKYVEFECRLCNHKWLAKPGNILSGRGCPNCVHIATGNRCRKEHKQFIKELSQINSRVKIHDTYIGNKIKLKTECLVCGHIWMVAPKTLIINKGCPICNSSKGEIRIFEYLSNKGIKFVHQQSFNELVGLGGKPLSYDFYIPELNVLIEYQGIQHEKPIDFKGVGMQNAKYNFKIQKEHDKRKKIYAEQNQIELLEIWYWDYDNIEFIIDDVIKGRRIRYDRK